VAASADQPGFQRRQAYLIRLLAGLAVFIKQPTVGIALAIVLYLAARRTRGQRERLAGERWRCAPACCDAADRRLLCGARCARRVLGRRLAYNLAYSTAGWESRWWRAGQAAAAVAQRLPQLAFIGYGVALLWARWAAAASRWTALVVVGLIDLRSKCCSSISPAVRALLHHAAADPGGLRRPDLLARARPAESRRHSQPATSALALALMAAFSWARNRLCRRHAAVPARRATTGDRYLSARRRQMTACWCGHAAAVNFCGAARRASCSSRSAGAAPTRR
jgi:hypothetical protein